MICLRLTSMSKKLSAVHNIMFGSCASTATTATGLAGTGTDYIEAGTDQRDEI